LLGQDISDSVEHRYADSDGVSIHYAKAGHGPMAVFIHGFPDYWYSWRHQMSALAAEYTVIAIDTRGYNLSDKPQGVENYAMELLVGDVAAVIANEGQESAIIVGHDWGGAIAWSFAAAKPEMTDQLIIVNLPHLKGLVRELAKLGQQHQNSQYARNFQQPDSHQYISVDTLASSRAQGDTALQEKYLEAFQRSSTESMMNYYKANYPREPYTSGSFVELDKIKMPVLQFHGLNDRALLPGALNDTWEELEKNWTLVTVPGAGHWVHVEKPEFVNEMILAWLRLQ